MPILAHLQADLNGKPLLETLIDKVDLGALVAAITYVEKSSTNAVNAYASLDENDPNLASKVNERIIPVYDNDLYTNDFEGKIRYNATYQNGSVKVERQVYGCTLTEKSDGAGDYVWVPDCKFTIEASYSLSPYDMVSINNLSRLSAIENDLDISTNGVADLPALALVYISQEQTSNKTWQAINLAGTVVGSGGALIAYRAGKLAIATLEAATALGSMGQDGINMGLIPAEYQNEIANYNLIAGGLGLTAGATALPKLGALAVQQVRSGLSSAISRVSAQRFLDAFERLKSNTAQWATLRNTAQGRAVQQKLTNLAKYLTSKGMKAGQAVESGLLAASAVKRWGQKTATGLVLLTNMFVVDPAVLARGGDMVEAVTKVEAKVGFKANGVVLKNDIPTSFSPISVRGATPLETVPSVLQDVGLELADDIATDGTLLNATLQQGPRQVTMQQASVGDYLLLQLGIAGLGTVYLAQKNQNTDDCSICKGIIINGQNRNEVCNSLEALAAKAGLTYKTIIENRLCKSTLSNLRLSEVATQLTTYSQAEIQDFLKNLNASSCTSADLCGNIGQLNVAIVEAWKVLYSREDHRKSMAYLNQIVKMIRNTKIQNNLNLGSDSYKDVLKMIATNHKDRAGVQFGGSTALLGYLTSLEQIINTYDGKTGFKESLPPLKVNTLQGFDGIWFSIKAMQDIDASNVVRVDMEFDEDQDCGTASNPASCKYDLETSGTPRFYEFKSYKVSTSGFPKFSQLKAYFARIRSMNDLVYYFEKRFSKVQDEAEVKVALQKLLCTNCQDATATTKTLSTSGNELFEKIWGNNLGLRESLFKDDGIDFTQSDNIIRPIGLAKFQEKVSSLSNSLYSFIKVK